MRIDTGVTGGVGGTGAVRSGKGVGSAELSSKEAGVSGVRDDFSVSSKAQQVAILRDKLNDVPIIRASKIEEITGQFSTKTYRPDSEAVVDKILKEHKSNYNYQT